MIAPNDLILSQSRWIVSFAQVDGTMKAQQRHRKHFTNDTATKLARSKVAKLEAKNANGVEFMGSHQLGGMGGAVSSPSRSGQSPADKQFYGNFRLRKPVL